MISIKSTFNKIQSKQPSLGACPILAQAVRDKGFTQSSIARAFTKLVPKEEYDLSERRAVIKHLTNLSNPLEDDKIKAKSGQGNVFLSKTDKAVICNQVPS